MKTVPTLQECVTTLAPAEVLAAAKQFFARRPGIYSAFIDREGENFATFRGQGGEEIVIGVAPADGGTRVTGSTYLFDMQVARFFTTLPMAEGNAMRTGETAAPAGSAS
ncbi:MAG: hypothetical protein HOQ11_06140 [Gemmatimonadaceae bacterium]|nr:hypothetical protein [Gemmatimonadaceae bacterium]NUQ93448.1 hypothetical protein [Gemmatimonadaceae bacterium]NUR19808.1 hypothetical protein [Gemmatimonadaceae bacterium]NUS96967.1 hypothetical protein [Gemmatimonadaceae bacterium]